MTLFETERLTIRYLKNKDRNFFVELVSDPKIIDPIPQPKYTESQIAERFSKNLDLKGSVLENEKCTCGVFIKGKPEMIGLCIFLINDDNEHELGYRFRVDYWGKGYGTEMTKGMIDYYFKELNVEKVTADVAIENTDSVNILNKFMKPVREFFNERDNCMDRRYEVQKSNWPA